MNVIYITESIIHRYRLPVIIHLHPFIIQSDYLHIAGLGMNIYISNGEFKYIKWQMIVIKSLSLYKKRNPVQIS